MDFVTRLPSMTKKHDSIMVVVDNFSNESHFILARSTRKANDITKIFMKDIFQLHSLLKAIISNHDSKFTSKFWKGLFQDLGMQLNIRIIFHLEKNGKNEMVNQVLEYML